MDAMESDCAESLKQAQAKLAKALKDFKLTKRKDLKELGQFIKPPPSLIPCFRASMILRGVPRAEKAEWDAIKADLKKESFINDFIALIEREKDNLVATRMNKLASITKLPELTVDKLRNVSLVAAQIYTVVLAVEAYYQAKVQAKLVNEKI